MTQEFDRLDVLAVYTGLSTGRGLPQELVGHMIGDYGIMTLGSVLVISSKKLNPAIEAIVPRIKDIRPFDKDREEFNTWLQDALKAFDGETVSIPFGIQPVSPDEVEWPV